MIRGTVASESKRSVMSIEIGSQPHLKVLNMSRIEVKVPSTMTPCGAAGAGSSASRAASCTAIAPPSEWPKT